MTGDGSHTYSYNAEELMTQFKDMGGNVLASYIYDAGGNRVRKEAGGAWTEYISFGGATIAEKNSDGSWSDYIFANGQRVAKADSYDARLHIHGTNCANCGWQYSGFNLPFSNSNYVIKSGDKLYVRQYQAGGGRGGIYINFTNGTDTNWSTYDQDGQLLNTDNTTYRWHNRTIDLSAHAGKTIAAFALDADGNSLAGDWDLYYSDIAIVSSDGTVSSIFARQAALSATQWWGSAGVSNKSFVDERSGTAGDSVLAPLTTYYYHGDHLGSSRMMSAGGGWPVWSATYAPYGQEIAAQASDNHYKFTGDEHDAESNLEHTDFRQLNTVAGRWMSPDPYAGSMDIGNPQSLNRYSYVLNATLAFSDPLGLVCSANVGERDSPCNPANSGGGGHDGGSFVSGSAWDIANIPVSTAAYFPGSGGGYFYWNPGYIPITGTGLTATNGLPTWSTADGLSAGIWMLGGGSSGSGPYMSARKFTGPSSPPLHQPKPGEVRKTNGCIAKGAWAGIRDAVGIGNLSFSDNPNLPVILNPDDVSGSMLEVAKAGLVIIKNPAVERALIKAGGKLAADFIPAIGWGVGAATAIHAAHEGWTSYKECIE